MYVVENVPGMKKFEVVMEALTRLPEYYVRVECPVNANIWLPQERKRLILIGTKRPFNNLEYPNSKPIRLRDIIESDIDILLPQYAINRINGVGKYRDKPIISDPNNDDIAPCAVAHYGKDRSTKLLKVNGKLRPYSVREYARLQVFDEEFNFVGSDSKVYKQIGNAVPVPMARWIGEQVKKYFNN